MLMDPNPQANTTNYPISEGKGGGRNTADPSASTLQPTNLFFFNLQKSRLFCSTIGDCKS